MSVKVEFRGNFLLVGREGRLEQIILPNCDTEDQRNLERRGWLINWNRRHYAGMVVEAPNGSRKPVPMSRGDSVMIGSPDDPAPALPPSITRGLPNLQEYKLSIETGTVAASIRLHGGTLEGFLPAKAKNPKFEHPQAKGDLCLSVLWTLPDADRLEVRVNDKRSIPILATETVIIYSFDQEHPTTAELRGEREMTAEAGRMRDRDFEWLYQLYAAPPQERTVPTAPQPSEGEVHPLTFNVSSCFPGGDIQPPDA